VLTEEGVAPLEVVHRGRRAYDVFAEAWPTRSGDPVADRLNSMRKLVASTTLADPTWANTEVVAGELARRVKELKSERGGNIVQYGVRQRCYRTGCFRVVG
jgi:hypothetical protein